MRKGKVVGKKRSSMWAGIFNDLTERELAGKRGGREGKGSP